MKKFKIGDTVKIVDYGKSYTTYRKWFDKNAPELASRYCYDEIPKKGKNYTIKAMAPHGHFDCTLYAIENCNSEQGIYLVGEEGIEKV